MKSRFQPLIFRECNFSKRTKNRTALHAKEGLSSSLAQPSKALPGLKLEDPGTWKTHRKGTNLFQPMGFSKGKKHDNFQGCSWKISISSKNLPSFTMLFYTIFNAKVCSSFSVIVYFLYLDIGHDLPDPRSGHVHSLGVGSRIVDWIASSNPGWLGNTLHRGLYYPVVSGLW